MKPTMLVVDDEPANAGGVVRTFRREFEVEALCDPAAALERIKSRAYDVLLVDQRMPGVCGVELCAEAARRHPYMARAVMTGYLDVRDLIDCINEGGVLAYLAKPFSREELRDVVMGAIALVARRRALGEAALTLPRPDAGTVLVVDGDEAAARATAALFPKAQTATSVAAARRICEREPISLLVTEPDLPDGDGLQLCEEVRRRSPLTYRMTCTARTDIEVLIESINRARVDSHLRKPMAKPALSGALEKMGWISPSRVEREIALLESA